MNRKLVSNALTGIDDELICGALTYRVAGRSRAPERKTTMQSKHTEKIQGASKRLISLMLAACLLLALTVTAYAANLFGIREMYANPNRGEMPQAAQALVEPQQGSVQGDGFACQVTESYCDDNTILLTLHISADEGYVLADSSADPNSPLWAVGLPGEGSLAGYAFGQDRKLLFVGASLPWEELGLSGLSQRAEYLSDRELLLYLEATKSGSATDLETVCRVSVQAVGPEDLDAPLDPLAILRMEIPVTMREGESDLLGVYAPENPDAIPGLRLDEIVLKRTPLGITLRLKGTVTDAASEEKLMTLRVEGLEFHGEGSMGVQEDGSFLAEEQQGQGEVGEALTVTFLNWNKEPVGSAVFVKK